MTHDAPEFHTETLSPLSPLPVHPPEPAKIPVLEKQIDPIFNMTSTHLDLDPASLVAAAAADPDPVPNPIVDASADQDKSPSAHSSFSDAYNEQPEDANKQAHETADQDTEVSDDYAMTFDSDAEDQAESEEPSKAVLEPDPLSLPVIPNSQGFPSPYAAISSNVTNLPNQAEINPAPIPPATETTIESPRANASDHSADQVADDATNPHNHTYEEIASGGIDIQQLLDNITANAEKNAEKNAATSDTSTPNISNVSPTSLPSHASLPPRPNIPQKRPFPNDIQKFHAGVQGPPPAAAAFRANTAASLVAAGAPGTSTDPRGGLPPPPSLGAPHISSAGNINSQINRFPAPGVQARSIGSQDEADELDQKWGPEVQKIYDQFLDNERMYVTEGLWDRFPIGSRLFIGNLPSEKVTKRDIFHIFHHHGKIAQISIKQAYGFVQFHESSACYKALESEQGSELRGKKMHLEISKPQKNTRNAQAPGGVPVRRSRSPDYPRGGGGRGLDRYEGRGGPSMRTDEYGRPLRVRDDYRPVRSPSPPPSRGSYRGREEYLPRGRDSYDSRDRRRSRSRSPYGHMEPSRYRERSPSPRTREAMEDASLSIPRRDPRDVPDVQLILTEQLDRQFVTWVETEIRSRGVKVEVMFLGPRLPLEAVVRRQILEGVHAVSKLDMRSQNMSKIPLQVFDRQGGGNNNVRFDEYQDLDPKIAAELALRAKSASIVQNIPFVPLQQQFPPVQGFQHPSQQQQQLPQAQAGFNVASLMGQLDNATLQKLLGTLSAQAPAPILQQQHANPPAVAQNAAIDLAGLLGGLQRAPQQTQQLYQQQPYNIPNGNGNPAPLPIALPTPNHAMPNGNPHLVYNPATPVQQQQQQQQQTQPQQSAQQVQNIIAQLARYRQ